jgi:hypothetical protein
MLVSQWIRRQHAVVSAALVCHKQASTGEIVSSTNLGMYGNTESLLKFSSRSWAPSISLTGSKEKFKRTKTSAPINGKPKLTRWHLFPSACQKLEALLQPALFIRLAEQTQNHTDNEESQTRANHSSPSCYSLALCISMLAFKLASQVVALTSYFCKSSVQISSS